MVFSSSVFLFLFLPVVLAIYYNPWCKARWFRNTFLFAASLLFYAWGEPMFALIMLVSVLLNWLIGLGMQAPKMKRPLLVAAIVYNLGLLAFFKYTGFFLDNLGLLLGKSFAFELALPIGISFFTFQILSYVFDVYRGDAAVQKNPLNVGLYIALFPQLIAGPIVRYGTVAQAIDHRCESFGEFAQGMRRFSYGLGKKVLLANSMALAADAVFVRSADSVLAVSTVWLGALAYMLQIFFDFSGYSDMAIGLGHMFGFHFEENFNYPYIASSITDFWRRWHMSLSGWFRDYVYIPLGGNRKGKTRQLFNLLIVWTLTGLWHGANWTFLVWGFGYFVLLAFEKFVWKPRERSVLGHGLTLFFVLLLWVVFRAETLSAAGRFYRMMFGWGALWEPQTAALLRGCGVILPVALVLCTPVCEWLRKKLAAHERLCAWGGAVAMTAVFVLSACVCATGNYSPFIYFNF